MFFIYNNGRSIFNLNHIARIYVLSEGTENRYNVVLSSAVIYNITQDEYNRLIRFIKAHCC